MINLYDNNTINDEVIKDMYNILINNLFITYPSFLKEKDKHDNKENYDKWKYMIKNTNDYYILTYISDNELTGFLNYSIIDNNLWISEVQIKDSYKNKGILKKLLKEFIYVDICNNYKDITIRINKNNEVSKKVFSHIGFINTKDTLYKISINELKNYINN